MQADILCLGEPLFEFNQAQGDQQQGLYLQGYGGDTSNAAVAAARQGARVGYITALGQDNFGDEFVELWQREGIDTGLVKRDPGAHTGIYFVSHTTQGHAFTYFRAGSAASLLKPSDLSESAIASAKILHVSGISQAISDSACDTVFSAIDIARANGVKVSYDTNLRLKLWDLPRARAITHSAIALCDIALPSYEDAEQLTGLDDADAIVNFYLQLGAPIVVLKLGAEGALVATSGFRRRIPGNRVKAVDATGAGDTFGGAFLARHVLGDSLEDAARYANAAAALSTRGYGAVEPIPTQEDVVKFLDQQTQDS